MISEIIMWTTIFWSMPFFVPDGEGGYQEWTLNIVDKICNGVDCIAGLTSAYPIATIQIIETHIFDTQMRGPFGCTVFMHEMWHAWHQDWKHIKMMSGKSWCQWR